MRPLAAALLALPLAGASSAQGVLGPSQFVRWRGHELEAELPPEWLDVHGPIGTACLTGDDRIGKSTLLTHWGRSVLNSGEFAFPSSRGRTSHTLGLWSSLLPAEATGFGFHLHLCDSQGLKQGTEREVQRLFSANVLLPDVVVYMLFNVVQNDQLRDLAQMAYQFQQLSPEDLSRFGRLLSPHLVVLVREESELDGVGREGEHNLTSHLEEALDRPGFEDDKQLIRQVFRTREAWALRRLPSEALDASTPGPPRLSAAAGPWRRSADAALHRVVRALVERRAGFPQNGRQLGEWCRAAVATANGAEDGSLARLVGRSELLDVRRQRRAWLALWQEPTAIAFVGMALVLGLGGVLDRWLDRAAWCAWVFLCISYIGTSPLVTTPLMGVMPLYCETLQGPSLALVRLLCLEASAPSAAVLLAAMIGVLSYPLLTAQLERALGLLALPQPLCRSGAALGLAAIVGAVATLRAGATVGSGGRCSQGTFAAYSCLAASVAFSGAGWARSAWRNQRSLVAGERGRALHFYVAERLVELRALQRSKAWAAHYRRHDSRDADWRCRRVPARQQAAVCTQGCSLLAWAWLIYPYCDAVLAAGAVTNALHLAWCAATACRKRSRRPLCPVAEWWQSLPESEGESEAGDQPSGMGIGEAKSEKWTECKAPAGASGAAQWWPNVLLPETPEDLEQRKAIEEMRIAQERALQRR